MSLKQSNCDVTEGNICDELLFKTYHNSIQTNKEDLAKRIAFSTNTNNECGVGNSENELVDSYPAKFNEGDYVRATYVDGIDYEAKIISMNNETGTCIVRYIGFDNEFEVDISTLISSWGKKYRRSQYIESKNQMAEDHTMDQDQDSRKFNCRKHLLTPPLPPVFPDMTAKTEHLSAMLMAWYMSGYYTGIYDAKDELNRAKKGGKYAGMNI